MLLAKRKKKVPRAEAASLGFRDKLVLLKVGFDLRGQYEQYVNEPLPDELVRCLGPLNRTVLELEQHSERVVSLEAGRGFKRREELSWNIYGRLSVSGSDECWKFLDTVQAPTGGDAAVEGLRIVREHPECEPGDIEVRGIFKRGDAPH